MLLGEPVPDRTLRTGIPERTLYRRIAAFRYGGMEILSSFPKAKRRVLPPAVRRKIVDLEASRRTTRSARAAG